VLHVKRRRVYGVFVVTLRNAELHGSAVVAGLAYGPVLKAQAELDPRVVSRFVAAAQEAPADAAERYDTAVALVVEGFAARAAAASGAAAEVLTASASLAKDKGLRRAVVRSLNNGDGLVDAVRGAVQQFADMFASMGGLMAERVTDLNDIGQRIIARIVGAPEPGVPAVHEPCVLVADDLAPADTAGLDPAEILAIVTERGGPTSHTAIIARQLGIPCVVAVAGATSLQTGETVLVDGAEGTISRDVDEARARAEVEEDRAVRAAIARWSGPARTADGVAVKLMANVADPATAASAAGQPIEGVGLFRTELGFLDQPEEPSVEAQAAVYAEVFRPFADGRTVVVRTLDAGSDKPIAYATEQHEDNPALGLRGARISLRHPEIADHQLDAIAAAAEATGVRPWVMAPMIATVDEAAEFAAAVRARGMTPGVMVEIPSAALHADRLLRVVDFVSIGTNDLTQYTMAADRLASDLAALTDPWQPAVLELVARTADAGRAAGKPVGVCGEAAADPLLACALIGMGVTSLSMAAGSVRAVGAQLAQVTRAQCAAAAEAALSAMSATEARAAVRNLIH
jgi:phosphotransferase system enzyme I (PtsI)